MPQKNCKYGLKCNRINCYFIHPPDWNPIEQLHKKNTKLDYKDQPKLVVKRERSREQSREQSNSSDNSNYRHNNSKKYKKTNNNITDDNTTEYMRLRQRGSVCLDHVDGMCYNKHCKFTHLPHEKIQSMFIFKNNFIKNRMCDLIKNLNDKMQEITTDLKIIEDKQTNVEHLMNKVEINILTDLKNKAETELRTLTNIYYEMKTITQHWTIMDSSVDLSALMPT